MGIRFEAGAEPVPGYRLIEPLGRGGFGEVWKAEGPGGFKLALKFVQLTDGVGSAELRALDVIRDIRHPHLLITFGAWQVESWLVIALELAEGTLLDRFRTAAGQGLPGIPASEVLAHLRDAADGLDYLNEPRHPSDGTETVGIQHRDVKPQNLLLVGGRVKVADFGLARVLAHSQTSHTGSMSPAYAAPEFFERKTSSQSDQYSLAVTYCHLRGGRLPFTGNMAEVAAGHLYHPPDLTMLPEAERPAVARALARAPRDRWPSCRAFVEAVAAAAEDDVGRRRDAATRRQATSGRGRNMLAVGVAVVAVALGLGLWGTGALAPSGSSDKNSTAQTVSRPSDVPQPGAGPAAPPPAADGPAARVRVPALTLEVPGSLTVGLGLTTTFPLRVRRDGFEGPVSVAFVGFPDGVRLEPKTIPAGETRTDIEITANLSAPTGDRPVRVLGTGGSARTEASLTMAVVESAAACTERGVALLRAHQADQAIREFDNALQIDPRSVLAYTHRGVAYRYKGEYDRAIADYDEAIRLDPKDAVAYYNRGLARYEKKEFDRAVVDHGEAIRLDPNYALAYTNRGRAYAAQGEIDRAIADQSEAIRLDPKDAWAYYNRGLAHYDKKQYDRAIADYSEAIRLDPRHDWAYYNRGNAYRVTGEIDRAVADYGEAIRLDPRHAWAYYNRGLTRYDKKEYERAIADYDEAIRLDPRHTWAYYNRGNAYCAKGDFDRAIADYDEAIRLDPNLELARSNREIALSKRQEAR